VPGEKKDKICKKSQEGENDRITIPPDPAAQISH
jgi:hypothetical protein